MAGCMTLPWTTPNTVEGHRGFAGDGRRIGLQIALGAICNPIISETKLERPLLFLYGLEHRSDSHDTNAGLARFISLGKRLNHEDKRSSSSIS